MKQENRRNTDKRLRKLVLNNVVHPKRNSLKKIYYINKNTYLFLKNLCFWTQDLKNNESNLDLVENELKEKCYQIPMLNH